MSEAMVLPQLLKVGPVQLSVKARVCCGLAGLMIEVLLHGEERVAVLRRLQSQDEWEVVW